VKNHKTGAKEIFVQDVAHKIYLISNTGKVVWTKQLQEPIIGKIHQIDVYKNNKLQLLFNTANKLYLLDRNGNNVEKYPIKLKSPATNGVTPLDYSHNRNYRILIGCNDNMVYNYNIQGDLVDGWKYQTATSFANQKIWHFAMAGKDYIVVPLANGQLKILERSGKDRLSITEKLPVGDNEVFLKIGRELSKTYLAKVDTNGTLIKVYLNNKKKAITYNNIVSGASFGMYNNQFVFSNNNMFYVFDNEERLIYSSEMEVNLSHPPFLLQHKKIGAVGGNQVYIFNAKGIVEDGFPLSGTTPFSITDINNDKTINLVVGDGNKIVTYNLKD